MSSRTAPSWIAALALASTSPAASAQTAEAQALFDEGKELLKEGKIDEACAKLDASERVSPAGGTEGKLAECYEKQGKTASAWEMYKRAEASAKAANKEERAAQAEKAAKALSGKLVHLSVVVPDESDVKGLAITVNGKARDRATWGDQVPVDPDEYEITAEAPGRESWSKTITIKTKDKTVEIPKLVRVKVDKDKSHSERDTAEVPERKYGSAMIALAAVGVGGLVLGTGFALYARDVEGQSDAICPGIKCADPRGIDLNSTARLDATIADIAWGVGGAAVIGATALWVIGRPSDPDAVSVAPLAGRGRAGIAIGGRF